MGFFRRKKWYAIGFIDRSGIKPIERQVALMAKCEADANYQFLQQYRHQNEITYIKMVQ